MSERSASRLAERYQAQDLARIERAVRGMEKNSDMRAFLRYILTLSGVAVSSFVPGDGLTTAYNCGRSDVGREFFDILEAASPGLASKLRQEDLDEHRDRTTNINAAIFDGNSAFAGNFDDGDADEFPGDAD